MPHIRQLSDEEIAQVFGGDSWAGTPEGREPVTDYWGLVCDAMGLAAGAAASAARAQASVANAFGESVKLWCTNGFVNPGAARQVPESPFGGGGATGSWGDPGSLKDSTNRRLA